MVLCFSFRNPKIKKLLEDRLDENWKSLRVTKTNFHLKELLPSFQDKVCNAFMSKDHQMFILGKSYAKPGNKVIVTNGELESPSSKRSESRESYNFDVINIITTIFISFLNFMVMGSRELD